MKESENFKFEDHIRHFFKETSHTDPAEAGPAQGKGNTEPSIQDIQFDIKPSELIAYLKNYIVGQDKGIETLATKICTHFHRMKLEMNNPKLSRIIGNVKSNILMIGPTGVGKTYLVRLIANKLKVPFVKGDATKFSETGYVGGDVEDLVRELVHQVGGNIRLAELGIIYIDEIDKIASSLNWTGPDVSRGGVQRNLLKLMEETDVDMRVPHDLSSQMEAMLETQRTGKAARKRVNTRNILFIMSGAFNNLPEIIAQRLKTGGMGFTGEKLPSHIETEYLLDHLHTQDLVKFGYEAEFVGRLPIITYLNDLTEEGLYEILQNPNSAVILGKKRDFASYGIDLTFSDQALRLIAKQAILHKTGARGLVTVIEKMLLPFEKSLPSSNIKELHITPDLINSSEQVINRMIMDSAFKEFAEQFAQDSGIEIEFSEGAIKAINRIALKEGKSVESVLQNILEDYKYGLTLVGKTNLKITNTLIQDPKGYLDRLVKQSYRKEE